MLRSDLVAELPLHYLRRMALTTAHDSGHASEGLSNGIVRRPFGKLAYRTEAAVRGVDEARIPSPALLVRDPQLVQHARPKILSQHVSPANQSLHHRGRIGVL